MTFLKVIRWKNLMMIALVQALIHFHLMPVFKLTSNLTDLTFVLLVLASVFIAAAGYIVNDIYDLEADKINKPESVWIPKYLSVKNAYLWYAVITSIGMVLGFLVVIYTKDLIGLFWFVLPAILLYLYARWIKKILFLGNILIALLIAFSLVIVVLFEQVEMSTATISISFFETIFGLVLFAFLLNLTREIIKDAQDVIGDKVIGVNSIPLKYGNKITHVIIQGIIGLLFGFILVIAIKYYSTQLALVVYLITAVLTGLFLFLSQLQKVKKSSDYKVLSSILKLVMFAGIISMFFIKYHN